MRVAAAKASVRLDIFDGFLWLVLETPFGIPANGFGSQTVSISGPNQCRYRDSRLEFRMRGREPKNIASNLTTDWLKT